RGRARRLGVQDQLPLVGVVVDPLRLERVEVAAEAELGAGALEGLCLGGRAGDGLGAVTALAGAAAGDAVDGEAADDTRLAPRLELGLPGARHEGDEPVLVDARVGVRQRLGAGLVPAYRAGAVLDLGLVEGLRERKGQFRPVDLR